MPTILLVFYLDNADHLELNIFLSKGADFLLKPLDLFNRFLIVGVIASMNTSNLTHNDGLMFIRSLRFGFSD